jgi:hypothetical protein
MRSQVSFTVLDFESCQFGPRELGGGDDVCPDQLLQGNLLGLQPAGSSDDTFKLLGRFAPAPELPRKLPASCHVLPDDCHADVFKPIWQKNRSMPERE